MGPAQQAGRLREKQCRTACFGSLLPKRSCRVRRSPPPLTRPHPYARPLDATLLTILLLLAFATVLALAQRYRRDRCLRSFADFHVTLVEDGGDVVWGRASVYSSGLEVKYAAPVAARGGHWERSFLFYEEQYEALGVIYRYPEGLSEEEQHRRSDIIRATAQPGLGRRLVRKLRNWTGMVRDALVQSIGVVVGMAQTHQPGAVVAQQGGEGVKALSKEMVGHVGTAYDPLLERHLFRQVVLEVTSKEGHTRSYCGWLKDYTSAFIEIVDAFANEAGAVRPVESYAPDTPQTPAPLRVENGTLSVTNDDDHLLYVEDVHEAAGGNGWRRALGCVLPPGATADLDLPSRLDPERIRVRLGVVERVDLVVPRRRAVVRHAADGSEARRASATTSVMADATPHADPDDRPATAETETNGSPKATEAQP